VSVVNIDKLIHSIEQRSGQSHVEIAQFVQGVASGKVSTHDATRWLKAVHRYGLQQEETAALTTTMMNSGERLEWEEGPPIVDKHSTGGVGDKMSIMLAPALAACGRRVPMLAGRGLGHTGGTIDKLESIPGFNCSLSPSEMKEVVDSVGCCIAVQNPSIAPADGVLYAIRDVTGTIDSLPLITASIISKKAAEGLEALVLDVKCGNAAFMRTIEDAEALAHSMVGTAKAMGFKAQAQITSMGEPIGTHVGNSLEIIESIHVLQGQGSPDTRELVVLQGATLLCMTDDTLSMADATRKIEQVLTNGQALKKFEQLCIHQGVDSDVAKHLINQPEAVLDVASQETTVLASRSGYVKSHDAMKIASMARAHGAGRTELEDIIDPGVGVVIHAKQGAPVNQNDPLFTFYHNRALSDEEKLLLHQVVELNEEPVKVTSRLLAIVE